MGWGFCRLALFFPCHPLLGLLSVSVRLYTVIAVLGASEAAGETCHQFCDRVSQTFRRLFDTCEVDYSDYVRTTETRHAAAVTHLWNSLVEKGHIYMGYVAIPLTVSTFP